MKKNISLYFWRALTVIILLIVVAEVAPLKVLTDWNIKVVDQNYTSNQMVQLSTTANKRFETTVKGSRRSLNCQVTPTTTVSIPINTVYPLIGKGVHKTITYVQLPSIGIAGTFRCHISIHVHYLLWNIKPIDQSNVTNDFTYTEKE